MHVGPRIAYALGLGAIIGKFVLLLTTNGRKSGKPRVTPLVYEERDGVILIASARGSSADWYQNIRGTPECSVRICDRRFPAHAEPVRDSEKIADYLNRQMARNPLFFGWILRMEGLPAAPSRADLVALATKRPMVEIHPL